MTVTPHGSGPLRAKKISTPQGPAYVLVPARRWPRIVAGIVVGAVVLVAGGVWWSTSRGGGNLTSAGASTPTGVSTASPAPSRPADLVGNDWADGCRGGKAVTVDMLTAAQHLSPITGKGAAEFAASFLRWGYEVPAPSASEIAAVNARFLAPTATAKLRTDEGRTWAPVGGTYHADFAGGAYYVEEASATGAVVTVGWKPVTTPTATAADYRAVVTVTLVASKDGWQVKSTSAIRTAQDLFSIGSPFMGGC